MLQIKKISLGVVLSQLVLGVAGFAAHAGEVPPMPRIQGIYKNGAGDQFKLHQTTTFSKSYSAAKEVFKFQDMQTGNQLVIIQGGGLGELLQARDRIPLFGPTDSIKGWVESRMNQILPVSRPLMRLLSWATDLRDIRIRSLSPTAQFLVERRSKKSLDSSNSATFNITATDAKGNEEDIGLISMRETNQQLVINVVFPELKKHTDIKSEYTETLTKVRDLTDEERLEK